MTEADNQYNSLLRRIVEDGEQRPPSRTGFGMKSLPLETFKFDIRKGFPIISYGFPIHFYGFPFNS